MFWSIFLAGLEHLLQRVFGWGNKQIVIAVTENTHEYIIHPAASSFSSENGKKIIGVKTVKNPGQNRARKNVVLNWENIWQRPVPLNISILIHIDEQEESHKDDWKSSGHEFLEEKTMSNKIESFSHIHKTCIDFCTEQHKMKYCDVQARLSRFKKSPIRFLTNMLNEHKPNWTQYIPTKWIIVAVVKTSTRCAFHIVWCPHSLLTITWKINLLLLLLLLMS